jgi:hypothetical protein
VTFETMARPHPLGQWQEHNLERFCGHCQKHQQLLT